MGSGREMCYNAVIGMNGKGGGDVRKQAVVLPSDPKRLLEMACSETDPVLKERFLLEAEKGAPDDADVQFELLMLGNLPRRDPKKIDYSVIKCYLLHAFEHPEQHDEDVQKRMTREIFDHDRLQKCRMLSEKPDMLMQKYLARLCREYLHIFIDGQREHTGGWLGFQWVGKRVKALSRPCADMIANMMLSPFLTEAECMLLTGVFYRECLSYLGNSAHLDAMLPAQLRERIR